MNSIEREQKKRQLKRRMIEPGKPPAQAGRRESHGETEEEIVRRAERHSRIRRLRLVLIFVFVIVAAVCGVLFYKQNHQIFRRHEV